ncbi:MAG: EF-hand domain-containing protein [Planctomycetia bacterium]
MIRFASVVALAFGFLSLSVVGFAQDEKKGKGKGALADPEMAFKRLYENGDGKVSKEEFKKAQNAMAEKMAEAGKDGLKKAFTDKPDLLDKMFAAMDTNKDGYLSLEEFKTGREKTRELMKDLFKKKGN